MEAWTIFIGFTVCHLNLRSLRRKVDELAITFNAYPFNVISLSETWLDETIEDTLVALDGCNLY